MQITTRFFEHYQDQVVEQICLTNDHHVSISVLTLGATWYTFDVPTQKQPKNLLLNFPHAADYLANPFYVGMAIGRTGGRLKAGQFKLNQHTFEVPRNEGLNTLHGGPKGFHQFNWAYTTQQHQTSASVTFKRIIPAQVDGFPGDLTATITYTLNNHNEVTIEFTGISTQATLFNPTSHAYFNLSDQPDILTHQLQINSDHYLAVDASKIPTGQFNTVTQTPFDFRQARLIKPAIQALQTTPEKGFDDIFNVKPTATHQIATLSDTQSQRQLTIHSKRNGLVVFTGNSFTSALPFLTGPGHPYQGIALEPQTLPDAPNHSDFGEITLPANQLKSYQIQYHYQQLPQ